MLAQHYKMNTIHFSADIGHYIVLPQFDSTNSVVILFCQLHSLSEADKCFLTVSTAIHVITTAPTTPTTPAATTKTSIGTTDTL